MLERLPPWLAAEIELLPEPETVTPVVAVPAPRGASREEPIRYTVQGVDARGEVVFLRSHGVDFNIMPRFLLRSGVRSIVSLGPGLAGGVEERSVLLVQTFSRGEQVIPRLEERVMRSGATVAVGHRHVYGRPCWLLSAVLSPVADCADGGVPSV